jgi:uncharacterized DUF497 family protein
MRLIISQAIQAKLTSKHSVSRKEVEECFENRDGRLLADSREDHQTDPPTLWFIAASNQQRLLKVVFVQRGTDVFLKSAFEPPPEELRIYRKYGYP